MAAVARLANASGAAALHALEHRPRLCRLSTLWDVLLSGRSQVVGHRLGETCFYLVVRAADETDDRARLRGHEGLFITRLLCGNQQKVIASDLAVANSTVSKLCGNALARLRLEGSPVPVPVALAAQASVTGLEIETAVEADFEQSGAWHTVVTVPRPRVAAGCALTLSEQQIVLHLIEGRSREEIAARRATSQQTVSAQLSTIFIKLGLSGRHGAIRRAAELGWFSHRGTAVPRGPRRGSGALQSAEIARRGPPQ